MRLVAFTSVRDERDIVEPFVRHTLAFASKLYVIDHGSGDGTSDVLASLVAEGLPLSVQRDARLGNRQAENMTRLLRVAVAETDADWFAPLDADEFLQFRPNSWQTLQSAREDQPLAIRWRGYVPDVSDDAAEANPVLRIRHRRVLPGWEDNKILLPRSLAARPDIRLRQGNHGVIAGDAEVPAVECPAITLAHFPVRSPEQYLAKATLRSLQYALMPDRDPAWGWAFDHVLAEALRDPTAVMSEYQTTAARYGLPESFRDTIAVASDSMEYLGGQLKYTSPASIQHSSFQSILCFVHQLIESHRSTAIPAGPTLAAIHRERQLRDQAVVIRQLERRVRDLEASNSIATEFPDIESSNRRSRMSGVGRWIGNAMSRLRRQAAVVCRNLVS